MSTPLDEALRLLAAGVSVIPVRPDGSKAPAVPEWKGAQERPYTAAQARSLWAGRVRGLAAVCGAVSGGLECLDFDVKPCSTGGRPSWRAAPGPAGPLVVVDTPEGAHCWYRCAEVEGNQKLARDAGRQGDDRDAGRGRVRGPAGSPAVCHPSGREYAYRRGHLAAVQVVAEAERALMHDLARGFDRFAELPAGAKAPPAAGPGQVTPWDDFDARGPGWQEILEPHGWRLVKGTWERGVPGPAGPGAEGVERDGRPRDEVRRAVLSSTFTRPTPGSRPAATARRGPGSSSTTGATTRPPPRRCGSSGTGRRGAGPTRPTARRANGHAGPAAAVPAVGDAAGRGLCPTRG
jgi:hypothetical protein